MKFRERTSVVCIAAIEGTDHLLCFAAIDPTSQKPFHFIPGGGLEPGETLIECAEREALEETGYQVKVQAQTVLTSRYFFHWDGKDFDCLTHFYRADLSGPWRPPEPVIDQGYNRGPVWIPVQRISELFSYTKEIQEAILKLI